LEFEGFSFKGFLKLIRVGNLAIVGLTQYMAAIFLGNRMASWIETAQDAKLAILIISTLCIAAAGYIINDYYDIKIDYINKPTRVLVGRVLKRRVAMVAHIALNVVGIGLGATVSLALGSINFVAAFLLWLYSNQLKRLPFAGNLVVSLLTAASVLILALYYQANQYLIYTYAMFAFSITLIRQIIKDMEDLEGDQKFGLQTLPIYWGIRRTKRFLYLLIGGFVSVIYFQLNQLQLPVLNVYFALLTPSMVHYIYWLTRADTKKAYHRLSNYTKLILISGVLSMGLI
jgi:4-hydroxybenzoate polyprenyltransferase